MHVGLRCRARRGVGQALADLLLHQAREPEGGAEALAPWAELSSSEVAHASAVAARPALPAAVLPLRSHVGGCVTEGMSGTLVPALTVLT